MKLGWYSSWLPRCSCLDGGHFYGPAVLCLPGHQRELSWAQPPAPSCSATLTSHWRPYPTGSVRWLRVAQAPGVRRTQPEAPQSTTAEGGERSRPGWVSGQERLRPAPPACSLPTSNRRPGWKQGVRSPTEGHFSGLLPAWTPSLHGSAKFPGSLLSISGSAPHFSQAPSPPPAPCTGPHVSPIAPSTLMAAENPMGL